MILLTSKELADIYGVTIQTVHNWVNRRKFPHHKTIGGQLRFDPNDVRSFCEKNKFKLPTRLIELTEYPWPN